MKEALSIVLFILLLGCSSKKQSEGGNSLSNEVFPPKGWEIISKCKADFNHDKMKDHAYVIQEKAETKPLNEEASPGDPPFHRKELIIKFKQKDGSYEINHRTSKIFGDYNWGIQGSDPFNKIGARRNTLKISFSIGGTLRSRLSYYFRYQDNDWYLIGYEESTYQAPSTDEFIKEINYLSGKKISYDLIDDKESNKKETNIGKSALLKLDDIDVMEHNEAGRE